MAPALIVRPHSSGLSSHAQETRSETSSQLSVDTTVDLTIQELFAEDSAPASTDTDIFSSGHWEDRTILPGLNLPVAGALSPGASQGMDFWNPPLVPSAATESCGNSASRQTRTQRRLPQIFLRRQLEPKQVPTDFGGTTDSHEHRGQKNR